MNVPNDPSALIELCKLVAPINAVKFTINASPITNTFLVMRHLSEYLNPVFFVFTLTNCPSFILSNCIVRSARYRLRFKSRRVAIIPPRVIVVEHVCHTYWIKKYFYQEETSLVDWHTEGPHDEIYWWLDWNIITAYITAGFPLINCFACRWSVVNDAIFAKSYAVLRIADRPEMS